MPADGDNAVVEPRRPNPMAEPDEPTRADRTGASTPWWTRRYPACFHHGEGRYPSIDRDGIVRYTYVECAREGLAGIGDMPSDEEILTAARAL